MLAIEEMLVRGITTRRIRREGSDRFQVSTRTISKDITHIRVLWRKEADGIDRQAQRDGMREKLTKVYERSMTRRTILRNADNQVIRYDDGTPKTMDSPDLRSGLRALQQLSRLDGLDESIKLGDADVGDLVGLMALAQVRRKKAKELGLNGSGSNGRPNGSGANGHE